MQTGQHFAAGTVESVSQKLRMLLAAANCDVTQPGPGVIRFRHGTVLTQSATLFPKRGEFRLSQAGEQACLAGEQVRIDWSVGATGFPRVWLTLMGVLLFFLVFPPILAYSALVYHPRKFVQNMLAGL